MADKPSGSGVSPTDASPNSQTQSDFARMVNAASFSVMLGLLITGAGLICFFGFYNRFSMYLFDAGFILVVFGIGVKVIDVLFKIIEGRK